MIRTSRSIEFPLAGTTRRTNKGPTQSQIIILFFPSILRYPYHELTYKAVSSVSNATIHRSGLSGLIDLWSFCNLIKFFPIDFSFYIVFSRGYFIPYSQLFSCTCNFKEFLVWSFSYTPTFIKKICCTTSCNFLAFLISTKFFPFDRCH